MTKDRGDNLAEIVMHTSLTDAINEGSYGEVFILWRAMETSLRESWVAKHPDLVQTLHDMYRKARTEFGYDDE